MRLRQDDFQTAVYGMLQQVCFLFVHARTNISETSFYHTYFTPDICDLWPLRTVVFLMQAVLRCP